MMQQTSDSLPPAIDFARLCRGDEPGLKAVIQRYGAFKVKNHGISVSARNECFSFCKSFFGQPDDLKTTDPAFLRFKGEKVKSTHIPKESLYVSKDKLCDYPPVQTLYKEIDKITPGLLQALSRTLALDPSLESFHNDKIDQLALHHYPDIPGASERNPAHRDWDLLTILIYEDTRSSNGLEVAELPATDNAEFTPVDPGPDEITILLGSTLPKLSKLHGWGGIRSCLHRVSGTGERYSIGCFINVDDDTRLNEEGTTARSHREMWETKSKVKD
ncbi:hypothetical protein BDV26DRAFT_264372 [Aspergillus bertholletiae]|uniref:Fe2OG dioxygenase domain-containing protein n=1 Tax=Aspergillus bertholletiae TaxID=1226010 RepID=A0A5N7B4Y5_9EURO|nr:hypothetical protein BDV26DRAFT_264372 [Aspergillus bertholletiae]